MSTTTPIKYGDPHRREAEECKGANLPAVHDPDGPLLHHFSGMVLELLDQLAHAGLLQRLDRHRQGVDDLQQLSDQLRVLFLDRLNQPRLEHHQTVVVDEPVAKTGR